MPKKSLVAKLVLAFILAAVPSMLLAGYLAGLLISKSVNMNVAHWLRISTAYVLTIMEDMRSRLAAVHTLQASRFLGGEFVFAPEELQAIRDVGADFITLTDERGTVLFSAPAPCQVEDEPLFPGSSWYIVRLPDEEGTALAVVEKYILTAEDGSTRTLVLGGLFAMELSKSGIEPLELRVYVPEGAGFREMYSSAPEAKLMVPDHAVKAVYDGAEEVFLPNPDWVDDSSGAHCLLTVSRDAQGAVQALFAVSAIMRSFNGYLPSSGTVFRLFLLLGTLLSGGVGYLLARGLMRPIRQLNKGVRQIALGRLGHRVPVKGRDEVAELAANFNSMSAQLEIARHENIENARRERARMLGEIAVGFAHEIRNPLVVIKTSAELLRNALPAEKKETRLLGLIVEEVGRIDALLSEFLNFAGPAPLKLAPFSLKPLVQSVLEMSAAELQKRGVIWNIVDELAVPANDADNRTDTEEHDRIMGEHNKIRQVLLNLVLNAMEAMPEGGRLDIRLFGSKNGRMLFLEVRDTGKGVPEEFAATAHLPFITSKKGSLGLGLAVVYAIIEAHGGSISFRSRPGLGTSFTVGLKR